MRPLLLRQDGNGRDQADDQQPKAAPAIVVILVRRGRDPGSPEIVVIVAHCQTARINAQQIEYSVGLPAWNQPQARR